MDSKRRTLLATGAAVTAVAAVPGAFAQPTAQGDRKLPFYEKGGVRIRYEEVGKGFPLLCIPGGGLNSTIAWMAKGAPFTAPEEFKNEYRVVTADLRNAYDGQSTGPVEVDRPWDSHTDDQLNLMEHLGHKKFMVIGFCIGGPMIWNLIKRAPDRIVAGILTQPSGFRKETPTSSYDSNMKGWGPDLVKHKPEIKMDTVERYLKNMYGNKPDFVYTVTRDFVKSVQTPVLILPDDSPPHPYVVAMESAMLAPKAEVSMFPFKEPVERIPLAVRQIRSFMRAHKPA